MYASNFANYMLCQHNTKQHNISRQSSSVLLKLTLTVPGMTTCNQKYPCHTTDMLCQ